MKTEQQIKDRIKGLESLKTTTLNRIGINSPEFNEISNGFNVEIKALNWVLN